MKIILERTRIIFEEYDDNDKNKIDKLVSTMDYVYSYKDDDNKRIYLPTGMLNSVKKLFPSIYIEDRSKTYWDYNTITPVKHDAEPRNQLQIDFINFLLEHSKKNEKLAGIGSPGVGKTFMACYSAIQIGTRTLIIVPTSSIKNQWGETLIKMFKIPENKVKIVNSPRDFINVKADFVVVSQSSLAVLNKNYDIEKIMKANKFGIKIIDEVQMWFKNIIMVDACSNIANNWYLTGTFGRSGDDENKLYQEMFGDLAIFREKDKEPTLFNRKPGNVYGMTPHMNVTMVWTKTGLPKEDLSKVTSTWKYSELSDKWTRVGTSIPALTSLLIPSDGSVTNYLKTVFRIIDIANKKVNYGKTLILSATIESTETLAKHVKKLYPDMKIGTIHSHNDRKTNNEAKANADIMLSTVASAGTGFDAPGLSKLIVLQEFKSWILADQVSGRLRRRSDKQDTYMWDVVCSDIKQLRVWANVRANVLKRKSKSFKVIDM